MALPDMVHIEIEALALNNNVNRNRSLYFALYWQAYKGMEITRSAFVNVRLP